MVCNSAILYSKDNKYYGVDNRMNKKILLKF